MIPVLFTLSPVAKCDHPHPTGQDIRDQIQQNHGRRKPEESEPRHVVHTTQSVAIDCEPKNHTAGGDQIYWLRTAGIHP